MITEEQLAKDREPIPYIPVKQLRRDRPLYVMKQTRPHPIRGYGNSHDEFSVVDIRGYRKGYEPRLDILGQYTPNAHDLFRLGTGRLPPYQPTATGDKLQAEMERLQVHKAWRINPMTPEEVPAVPEIEREAKIKYFRQQETKWRETALAIVDREGGVEAYADAVEKADAFGRQAAELEVPKPPVATEETIDLTKERMIEIPLDANGKAIPTESEGDNPLGGSNPHLLPENVPEEDFTTVTDVGSIYDLFSEGKISLRELDRLKDHYYKWYYSPERRTTVLRFYRQPDGTMTIYKQVYVQTYGESGNPGGGALTSKVAKVMGYRRLHPEYIPPDLTEEEFRVLEKVFTAVITATDFELSVKEAMLLWATADRGYLELRSPNPNPTGGTCYEDAWRFQIKQEEGILVHGSVTGADGKTVKHAWVELPTGFIYEPQTARFFKADVFKRAFNPKEDARYTVEEAAKQAARRGYHGAWAEEVPAVPEVTGKARLVPNLLDIAEESTNELVATLNDLPADIRNTFDGMLGFLDEYAQLATRGPAYPAASVNALYETVSGYRGDIGLAFGKPNEVFVERFNEAEANPTRANKVVAIDAFVSLVHERGAVIPAIFGQGLKRATGKGIGSVRERIFQEVTENVNTILDDLAKPPAVGDNPIPEKLDLARTLAIIDSRPKGRIIESKLREEFGDAIIDALRQGRYVVSGSAGYNPPLLVSLKGRELIQGGNPGKGVISKEEAIGMLERLSMTPKEAARSLVADEAERREIMQTVQQRVKREQNKWAPMDPRTGPPLPRVFGGLRWPWKK